MARVPPPTSVFEASTPAFYSTIMDMDSMRCIRDCVMSALEGSMCRGDFKHLHEYAVGGPVVTLEVVLPHLQCTPLELAIVYRCSRTFQVVLSALRDANRLFPNVAFSEVEGFTAMTRAVACFGVPDRPVFGHKSPWGASKSSAGQPMKVLTPEELDDPVFIKELLLAGGDPVCGTGAVGSPNLLHWAVLSGLVNVVRFLLGVGSVSLQSVYPTPEVYPAIIRTLLTSTTDPDTVVSVGDRVIDIGAVTVVGLLKVLRTENLVSVDVLTNLKLLLGMGLKLWVASELFDPETDEQVVSRATLPGSPFCSAEYQTLLQFCAKLRYTDSITVQDANRKAFLKLRDFFKYRNAYGETAFQECVRVFGRVRAVEWLLELVIDKDPVAHTTVKSRSVTGESLLHSLLAWAPTSTPGTLIPSASDAQENIFRSYTMNHPTVLVVNLVSTGGVSLSWKRYDDMTFVDVLVTRISEEIERTGCMTGVRGFLLCLQFAVLVLGAKVSDRALGRAPAKSTLSAFLWQQREAVTAVMPSYVWRLLRREVAPEDVSQPVLGAASVKTVDGLHSAAYACLLRDLGWVAWMTHRFGMGQVLETLPLYRNRLGLPGAAILDAGPLTDVSYVTPLLLAVAPFDTFAPCCDSIQVSLLDDTPEADSVTAEIIRLLVPGMSRDHINLQGGPNRDTVLHHLAHFANTKGFLELVKLRGGDLNYHARNKDDLTPLQVAFNRCLAAGSSKNHHVQQRCIVFVSAYFMVVQTTMDVVARSVVKDAVHWICLHIVGAKNGGDGLGVGMGMGTGSDGDAALNESSSSVFVNYLLENDAPKFVEEASRMHKMQLQVLRLSAKSKKFASEFQAEQALTTARAILQNEYMVAMMLLRNGKKEQEAVLDFMCMLVEDVRTIGVASGAGCGVGSAGDVLGSVSGPVLNISVIPTKEFVTTLPTYDSQMRICVRELAKALVNRVVTANSCEVSDLRSQVEKLAGLVQDAQKLVQQYQMELLAARKERDAAVHEKEVLCRANKDVGQERDMAFRERDTACQKRDSLARERDSAFKKRDLMAKEKDALIRERDGAVKDRTLAVRERDLAVKERNAAVIERDAAVTERDAAVTERDAAVTERDAAVTERDAAVTEKDAAVKERDAAVKERDAAVTERDAAVTERDAAVTERDAVVVKDHHVATEPEPESHSHPRVSTIVPYAAHGYRQVTTVLWLVMESLFWRASSREDTCATPYARVCSVWQMEQWFGHRHGGGVEKKVFGAMNTDALMQWRNNGWCLDTGVSCMNLLVHMQRVLSDPFQVPGHALFGVDFPSFSPPSCLQFFKLLDQFVEGGWSVTLLTWKGGLELSNCVDSVELRLRNTRASISVQYMEVWALQVNPLQLTSPDFFEIADRVVKAAQEVQAMTGASHATLHQISMQYIASHAGFAPICFPHYHAFASFKELVNAVPGLKAVNGDGDVFQCI